ncbi:DDE-type integrase/transposase/recombinase [Parabacteroides sp. Marseille-P3160]|uniref:integrase catalytic domain-containing protein n=1 Tax=Parabacteroides sp. Marseille-P3160 TaxID=1917887 RepID=UPI001356F9D4|nr:DDE-type integrase/transposase/recombinase [Parabacteroides sp. Marseille-P3160]
MNGKIYIEYNSIPNNTRRKLPSKENLIALTKEQEFNETTQQYYRQLERAYLKQYSSYLPVYKDLNIDLEKAIDYARHHAVWAEILNIHGDKGVRPQLRNLWEAYNRLYPRKYAYNRMNPCINTCKKEGIQRLLVHQYKIDGSHNKYDEIYTYWVAELLRSGKKYSRAYIHKFICELARENKKKEPSLSSIKNWVRQLMPVVASDRYGSDAYNYGKLPYTSMERATESDIQWQVDGWDLPFYMEGFRRLTLFWVIDACSGKVVGYQIAPSENTETILKGLENTVENTSVLPLEIVSDCHSFNKTSEADYFKDMLEKTAGTQWTASSNPRYKSLVERSFKTFGEQYCKDMPGYIGEGVKTKNPDGRTSQELLDQYQKAGNWLTEEHIRMIAIKCITEYNNAKGKDGLTRNERYEAKKSKNAIKIDMLDRLRLFTRTAKYKVSRGQINIIREGVLYEFQLRASLFNQWNDKYVHVRYVDFDEIYLFEVENDRYIGTVPRKQKIHGALADQTEEDKEKLFKHKGRLNGIKTGNKKTFEGIAKDAFSRDKDAAYSINPKLNNKDLIKEFERDGELRRELERQGVSLENVTSFPKVKEVKTYDPEEADRKAVKRRESPMLATEEEVRNFDINKYLEEE